MSPFPGEGAGARRPPCCSLPSPCQCEPPKALSRVFYPQEPVPRAHPSSPAPVPSPFARRGHQRKRGRTTRWSPCSPNRAVSPRVPAASEDPLEALLPFSGSSPATVHHSPATPSGKQTLAPREPLDLDLAVEVRSLTRSGIGHSQLATSAFLSAPITRRHLAPVLVNVVKI